MRIKIINVFTPANFYCNRQAVSFSNDPCLSSLHDVSHQDDVSKCHSNFTTTAT